MPYTTEQGYSELAEMASRTLSPTDERTGEVIQGDPYVALGGSPLHEIPHYYESESSAMQDGWVECERCGNLTHHEHSYRHLEVHGYSYCSPSCAHADGYYTCEQCGDWYHQDDEVEVDGNCYCSASCAHDAGYAECDRCGGWYDEDDGTEVCDEVWCERCADEYSDECASCGTRYPDNQMHYYEDDECWYCDDCYEEVPRRGTLHEYGWTPALTFYTEDGPWRGDTEKQPIFLGVELETDGGRQRSKYVGELSQIDGFDEHFWMTRDSSLDNGVEITGHPMTLAYHVSLLDTYDEISSVASENGFRSHDGGRCGLHIHVNRRAFGRDKRVQDAGGYKLMRLMQRFEHQFTVFSRRTDNHWCSYKTYGDYQLKDELKASRRNKDEAGPLQMAARMAENERSHAQCVNFEHRSTFEIRIFRGTLKWTTYFACLGLVDGMCRTVMAHGSTWVESVSWYDLMDEVERRCDSPYASECLADYLHGKGLC